MMYAVYVAAILAAQYQQARAELSRFPCLGIIKQTSVYLSYEQHPWIFLAYYAHREDDLLEARNEHKRCQVIYYSLRCAWEAAEYENYRQVFEYMQTLRLYLTEEDYRAGRLPQLPIVWR